MNINVYGAILNPGCRFFDKRIGQSTTLSGRAITRHMSEEINEILAGDRDHRGKTIIYNDTDSCYFSAWPVMQESVANGAVDWSPELCVQLYDTIAEQVNQSFPTFMERAFHTSHSNGSIIRGGRESVSRRGLFIKKKRYGILIYDLEGKRLDVDGRAGKVKATGLDLKRSDTPKAVQAFLSKLLQTVLEGASESQAQEMINNFRDEFKKSPAWEKGTPKRVNNLTKFTQQVERGSKASVPGHVRASINWNTLRRMYNDNYSMAITDGQKVVVCKLRPNPMNFTSVAYPVDEAHLPTWFLELPFDHSVMETTIVDQKVENLLGVLGWDLNNVTSTADSFNVLFG